MAPSSATDTLAAVDLVTTTVTAALLDTDGGIEMTNLRVEYIGDLQTTITHESGVEIKTDAPKDHAGQGRSFAPTDLLASSIGAASITYLAIQARKYGMPDLTGSTVEVEKVISVAPPRRVSCINISITLCSALNPRQVSELQWMVYNNPVLLSVQGSIAVHYYWK